MPLGARDRQLIQTLLPIPIVLAMTLLLLTGCGGSATRAQEDALGTATTIRVHYPRPVALRGDGGGLSWNADAALQGNVWTGQLRGRLQFKPTLDGAWSRGPNYAVDPGATVDVWPRFQSDTGRVERIDDWWSNGLQNRRPVWIYYPPSYDELPDARYPVLYFHDGQNLFDPSFSFAGVTWDVQGALDQGAADGSIREAIVIGIGNTPGRIWEYTPSDGGYGGGGAGRYLDFVVDELKPQIDQHLRTSTDRLDTGIVGSSLGGLVSACAGVWRPDVFGLVGAMSPSTWWNNEELVGMVQATRPAPVKPARVYVDSGDAGDSNDDVVETAQLAQAYRDVGWIDVGYTVGHGDRHEEAAWQRRLPGALRFLLGPRAALP